jgi:GNAT superfamily N-acetyltransferase
MDAVSTATELRWYGGRHPRELTEEEFMKLHRTGWIQTGAYEQYREVQGLSWLGTAAKYPVFVAALPTLHGQIAFRQTGRRNHYVALDAHGEILRDVHGLAMYMSVEEVVARGLPTHHETIVAFHGDVPVGWVSNEWGAVGVWVAERYQRCGIGTALVRRHLEGRPGACLGQMTAAGAALARAVHRSFATCEDGPNRRGFWAPTSRFCMRDAA